MLAADSQTHTQTHVHAQREKNTRTTNVQTWLLPKQLKNALHMRKQK